MSGSRRLDTRRGLNEREEEEEWWRRFVQELSFFVRL